MASVSKEAKALNTKVGVKRSGGVTVQRSTRNAQGRLLAQQRGATTFRQRREALANVRSTGGATGGRRRRL